MILKISDYFAAYYGRSNNRQRAMSSWSPKPRHRAAIIPEGNQLVLLNICINI